MLKVFQNRHVKLFVGAVNNPFFYIYHKRSIEMKEKDKEFIKVEKTAATRY